MRMEAIWAQRLVWSSLGGHEVSINRCWLYHVKMVREMRVEDDGEILRIANFMKVAVRISSFLATVATSSWDLV